jgi:serine/threonine protein kinase
VSEVQTEEELAEESYWQLCAVKRLHADRQSQLLGLDEAFALRRLGPHPNIVSLIDIRDEVELPTPVSLPGASGNTWASMPHDAPQPAASPLALGKGLPSRNGSISTIGGSAHARSSSTAHSRADLGLREPTAAPASHASDAAHAIALHRRLASQPSGPSQLLPEVRVAGPDEDGVGPLAHRSPSPAQSIADSTTPSPTPGTPSDPPRLLILLELLPHSLRSFARRNPERIGWLRWKTWALQLAGTVEWMHARGCVHVDIKPENILVSSSSAGGPVPID